MRLCLFFFFFKQKTAYEMRISDWSSDVCSSDLLVVTTPAVNAQKVAARAVSMSRKNFLRVCGVVENMSAFVCDHGQRYELFGSGGGAALAAESGTPLLGEIPMEPSMSVEGDAADPAALRYGPAGAAFRSLARRNIGRRSCREQLCTYVNF